MVSRTKFLRCTGLLPILLGVLAVGGLLLAAQPASATNPETGIGCIQDVWAAHGNSQNLTCTANDVRVAEVTNISISAGGTCDSSGCSCDPGTNGGNVTFSADYKILLTAQTRYDIGLYFATDGDSNGDGALTGQCSVFIITPGEENGTIFTNLDASPDICGEIINNTKTTNLNNPQILRLNNVTVPCVAGPDGNLKLPNCTSWRTSGQNDTCLGPDDAYPGAPSKCNCQPGFTIGIRVEHPTISVTKTADPTSLPEPGGDVTYTVHVTNNGSSATVTLTALTEDDTNDGTVDFTFNSTSTPTLASICGTTTLAPGASTDCTFTRTVSGSEGDVITDKACVSGTDSNGGTVTPSCATATVSITEAPRSAAITKTVERAVCAVVRYDVKVDNNSAVDTLTLKQLCDDKVGDISQGQNSNPACTVGDHSLLRSGTTTPCVLPQDIAAGSSYSCTFDALVCSFSNTDTVSGLLSDKDGGTDVTPTSGSATVTGVTVQTP